MPNIKVTRYQNDAGVSMHRCVKPDDKWLIVSHCGPAWYWNPTINKWEISLRLDDLTYLMVDEAEGLKILQTLTKKDAND